MRALCVARLVTYVQIRFSFVCWPFVPSTESPLVFFSKPRGEGWDGYTIKINKQRRERHDPASSICGDVGRDGRERVKLCNCFFFSINAKNSIHPSIHPSILTLSHSLYLLCRRASARACGPVPSLPPPHGPLRGPPCTHARTPAWRRDGPRTRPPRHGRGE